MDPYTSSHLRTETMPSPAPRLRQMPVLAQLFIGGVTALAVAWLARHTLAWSIHTVDWWALAFLAIGATISTFQNTVALLYALYYVMPTFTFVAVFLLGPAPTGILLAAAYIVIAWRWRQRWYIAAFNASTHYIAALAAYQTARAVINGGGILSPAGALGLITGAMAYVLVAHVLKVLGLYFARGSSSSELRVIRMEGIVTDLLFLCIGAGMIVLWYLSPILSIFALAPLALVRRVLGIPLLEEEARVEPKTGLYNARHANAVLELELERARELHQPLAVLMADLDGLRQINNTYGHLIGDEVLRRVADVIRSTVGAQGIAARFGGEEFVAILPGRDAHEAMAVAERIRRRVEALSLSPLGESGDTLDEQLHTTITIGVAAYPDDADTPLALLHKADTALYYGKDQGRNQVCMASSANGRLKSRQDIPLATTLAKPVKDENPTQLNSQEKGAGRRLVLMVAATIIAGGFLLMAYLPHVASIDLVALGILAALTWVSEGLALDLYTTSTVSLSFVMLLAAAFLLGPAGVAVIAPIIALTHAYRRRPPWYQVAFNLAGHMAAGTAASFVFRLPGVPIGSTTLPTLILPSALSALVYYAVNVGLVATVVALEERRSPIQVWQERYQWLWVHYVAMGFISLVLVVAYVGLGVYGIFAFLVPLFIVRYTQKQYIERTASNIQALKELNESLMAANAEIKQMNEELLGLLAKVIDFRDPYVYNHSEQVATYAVAIAQEMGLPADQVDVLRRAALCHDLGKIGIPDAILNKPGRLTDKEYNAIKAHPDIGAAMLESSHALYQLIPIVRHHHERWDGKGYPDHLAGTQIPLEARILAVADAVETMASDRPYKRGMSTDQILKELRRCAGTQFDPAVVDAFIRVVEHKGASFIVNSARRVTLERAQWIPRWNPLPAA
ncbi:MAG: diguanylate cyclase [Anaerolineae bacterium]|nr:diguanylate cyclase [Anaerolineae bacterium]